MPFFHLVFPISRLARLRFAGVVSLLAAAGCRAPAPSPAPDPLLSVNTLIEAPPDFALTRIGTPEYPIPAYAKHLKGVRIVLDPGHGGDAQRRGFKRGPTGVREAEMNLRVSQYLREFLVAAGAEVRLTREADVDRSHVDRAAVANDWPADVFISVHHNAIDDRPHVNYTTVWYHATVDHSPASLDLARYLCDELHDALALPQYADVPLKSDQLMYADGFAVLRHTRVPAALTESSFYTNPDQEQRLRRPEYNLREAHALFVGLAKYAAAGLPRARLVEPADGVVRREGDGSVRETAAAAAGETAGATDAAARAAARRLVFELDDGLRARRAWGHQRQMILSDSIVVRIDGRIVPHAFENEGYRLTADLPEDLAPGEHRVSVQFQNLNKNSVLNPYFVVVVR